MNRQRTPRGLAAGLSVALVCVGCGSTHADPANLRSRGAGPAAHTAAANPVASGSPDSSISLGAFAGYNYYRDVTSVQASWAVPLILPGSRSGFAGTWIGAAAPPSGTVDAPFIQVGTNERRGSLSAQKPLRDAYYAFYSDTVDSFHAQRLFPVSPGDQIVAKLILAHGRWSIVITDTRSGLAARLSTTDEGGAAFDEAEWMQEDVQNSTTGEPFPYPQLSAVRFEGLQVNSRKPIFSYLSPRWISAGTRLFAPGQVFEDSFTVRPATLSPAGRRYLEIASIEDSAANAFYKQMYWWTAFTPTASIASAGSAFAATLRANISSWSATPWPRTVRDLIHSLLGRTHILLSDLGAAPLKAPGRQQAWEAVITKDSKALGRTAYAIRSELNLPQLGAPPG